jgi:hypothetical protein
LFVEKCFKIPETYDFISDGLEKLRSLSVMNDLSGRCMVTTIKFDHKLCAVTGEVGEIRPNRRLAPKVQAAVLE